MINNNLLDEIKQIINISVNNERLDGILTGKDNQEVKQCYDIIRLGIIMKIIVIILKERKYSKKIWMTV